MPYEDGNRVYFGDDTVSDVEWRVGDATVWYFNRMTGTLCIAADWKAIKRFTKAIGGLPKDITLSVMNGHTLRARDVWHIVPLTHTRPLLAPYLRRVRRHSIRARIVRSIHRWFPWLGPK